MRRSALFVMTSIAILALSGLNCPRPASGPRVPGLQGFGSPDELKQYLADQATVNQGRSGGGFFGLLSGLGGMAAAPMANTADQATEGTSGPSFSTTNIQEAGVDESDIVKNDGQTIYSLDGSTIHVVRATPPTGVAELTKLTLPDNGDSLYLTGSKLVALSYSGYYYYGWSGGGVPMPMAAENAANSPTTPDTGSMPFPDRPQSTVTIFDVSDPANPVKTATVTLEGNLQGSRLIGNKLHLVVSSWPVLPDNPTADNITAMPIEQLLPRMQVADASGAVVQSGNAVGWQGVFRPISPDGYQITTVVTMDVTDPTVPFSSTAITANVGTVYASTSALYLTDTNYDWTSSGSREDTIIHKLAFTDTGTDYIGSGMIPGRPLNQYSLGEYNGYLRIATEINSSGFTDGTFQSTQTNNVYVLGVNGATLQVVGKIENIAPGESIYSARFVGDRGFLVTFLRTDPLFVMDLKDPANPAIVGELKVPGYSDHIQMLDENHLLTIGRDAEDVGTFAWIQGVQVSLFDVTDPANPALLDKEIIGGRGTTSEANYNPKAFNYYAAQNALAFPIDYYEGDTTGAEIGRHNFTGLLVYRVTVADGISSLGRISTDSGLDQTGCFLGYYGYTRGVFVDTTVYSVSQVGVKAADLSDVSTILGQVSFDNPTTLYRDCYWSWEIEIPPGGGLR